MPHYCFPRLTDDKEFENLIADCYRGLFNLPKEAVNIYGRNGQKQYGIDITVRLENQLWCVQCKNQENLTINDVEVILEKCTYSSINPFNRFVIATSAHNDARIIDYVIRVNNEKGLIYEVDYLPWEEICGYIETIPGIFQKYYGILDYSDPMISEFFEIVKKYDIPAFLRLDPLVEGVDIDYPEKLQLLVMEIQRVLDKNIDRNDLFYRKMSEFNFLLDSYNTNLGMILFLCGDKFKYLPPYSGYDSMYGEKSNLVLSYRKSLFQSLAKLQNL